MADKLDTSYHQRRHERRMQDPEYREGYERARREIDQVDSIMRLLEERRVQVGISKAELARRIQKNPAEVRRLLGNGRSNPQLATVLQMAAELGIELQPRLLTEAVRPTSEAS